VSNFEQNNRGVLFMEKKRSDKSPDWKGRIMIDGKEIRLAGWNKITGRGELISLSVDTYVPPVREKSTAQYPREVGRPTNAVPFDDSDIPF
jgi:hypothetical protein